MHIDISEYDFVNDHLSPYRKLSTRNYSLERLVYTLMDYRELYLKSSKPLLVFLGIDHAIKAEIKLEVENNDSRYFTSI